jgi:cell division protein FtsI (penicillin-binding protein 3)
MRNRAPAAAVGRMIWVRRILAFILIAFVLRLGWFQIVDAPRLNTLAKDKLGVSAVIPALRGDIVDDKGNVLATSVMSYDVNVDPTMVSPFERVDANQVTTQVSVAQATHEIAFITKADEVELAKKMLGTSHYANLVKEVDGTAFRRLQKLNIPWLFFENKPHRIYPNGALAGNLLGFMGSDGNPLEGLELSQNKCLAGINGQETYESGTDGIKIPSSRQVTVEPKQGGTLVLSINNDLQFYAQQVMAKYVKGERADWGSAVIVEAKTGKLLAAAEYPSVDPNNPLATDGVDRRSRIFQALFEPGSTLKTVTAATAIDQGKATPESRVVATQNAYVTKQHLLISDSHVHPPQNLTLTGVLRDSSNTGIIQIGIKVPLETRYQYWLKFGLGAKTAVNFPGEGSGIIHTPAKTDGLTLYTSMFGQGMSVTPIQTAFLYQTIANGGVRLSPQLLMGCKNADGSVTPLENVISPTRVVSTATARSTVDMLEKVVEQGGIGRTAGVPGYRVAGKSGTAQLKQGNGYGYLHAISFIGMAPADNPKYVLAVTIYRPRTVSNSLGATPAFKDIMQQILRTYRVPPSTTKSANIATEWK